MENPIHGYEFAKLFLWLVPLAPKLQYVTKQNVVGFFLNLFNDLEALFFLFYPSPRKDNHIVAYVYETMNTKRSTVRTPYHFFNGI